MGSLFLFPLRSNKLNQGVKELLRLEDQATVFQVPLGAGVSVEAEVWVPHLGGVRFPFPTTPLSNWTATPSPRLFLPQSS